MTQTPILSLVAGELSADFLPQLGMLGASLRFRGQELLGRVDDLDAARAKGNTAGIPLLYPWANRLSAFRYQAAGRAVELDPRSSLLHLEEHGLPIHGVPWARLAWQVTQATPTAIAAQLDWSGDRLLAVFPFRHRVELAVALHPDGLLLQTTVLANAGDAVPVSFGFHPYFSLSGKAPGSWRLRLPAMRRLALDGQGIPTGVQTPFAGFDAALDQVSFDDGFAIANETAALSLEGTDRRLTVELLSGYPFAQVFAPADKDYVALEPMTAQTSALTQPSGLRVVQPGSQFQAAFRIRVEQFS